MQYLHAMIRVQNLEKSLDFYVKQLGLKEIRRKDYPQGKFTLIYLATAEGQAEIELTHNWEQNQPYSQGKNFGHFAFRVDNIYQLCQQLMDAGITINRPPRDGHMAFVKCPDGISIELLQAGDALPAQEPWLSMENTGSW